MFFPGHANTVGAAIHSKAVHRPPRNFWRSSAVMVAASILRKYHEQHNIAIIVRKHSRTPASKTHSTCPAFQLEDTRAHRTAHISRLEHVITEAHHYLQHRHDMHDMGHTIPYKEVFDVRFCAGSVDVFVSCGADGSVRMFDLRSLEHSTIIYEPSDKGGDRDKGQCPSTQAHRHC
jgi:hypothetical protein